MNFSRQQEAQAPTPAPAAAPTPTLQVAPCVVCLVLPKNTFFLPCAHVCCCEDCAAILEARGIDGEPEGTYHCPICREKVTGRHRLFFT